MLAVLFRLPALCLEPPFVGSRSFGEGAAERQALESPGLTVALSGYRRRPPPPAGHVLAGRGGMNGFLHVFQVILKMVFTFFTPGRWAARGCFFIEQLEIDT